MTRRIARVSRRHVQAAEVRGSEPRRRGGRAAPARTAAGCSSISLCMNDASSPASYDAGVDVDRRRRPCAVAERSCRYVVKPSAVTIASSPSSRCTTASCARRSRRGRRRRYISFSPTPMISGRAVAGHHDPVREVGVQHRDAVGALDRARARRATALAGSSASRAGDQVGEHLGVGLGQRSVDPVVGRARWRSAAALSMMPLWTTATSPFASVCGCALTSVAGTVRGPAGVADADLAPEPLRASSSPRSRTRPARLATLSPAGAEHGDAGRVVAPVLQPASGPRPAAGRPAGCRCSRRFRTCVCPIRR